MEALNEYDAWRGLRESGDPLAVGDLVETEGGQCRVCKYVGFEPAKWALPEPKQPEPEPAGQSTASSEACMSDTAWATSSTTIAFAASAS